MSQLFLATERSLNRQVVVKVLPPEWASEVSAARFKQEIQVAAHLQHPNILPVLAAGANPDLVYYIMPYVTGESLRHRLTREGKLPVADAARVLWEVADALAYAHAHGVVHRDIKPENILLEQGHAVLADFGVARAITEARSGGRLTETGMAVGTPAYMSPEQVAGERNVDARADLYALAVVGYEMLAGAAPFSGPNAQAVMAAQLTDTPKSLRDVRADTPPAIAQAIGRALAKSPAERVATAAEFRDAIGTPTGAVPALSGRRRRLAWAAAVTGVAAVLAGVALFRPSGIEGDPRKSIIVFPFRNGTGDAQNDWLQEASMNLLDLSLSHWQDLRVFDDERTKSLMRRRGVAGADDLDFDVAQRISREAGVGTLVLGDVRREGDSLRVEAKVHDVASGNRLATEILRIRATADPRPLFDSLSARLLKVSGAPPGIQPAGAAQTTRSLEAYRAYLRGMNAMFRLLLDSAEAEFARAIRLDSTFALAYMRASQAEGWRTAEGDLDWRQSQSTRAEALAGNLSPRWKLLIQSQVAVDRQQWGRLRVVAEQMLGRDSTDVEAWHQLGEGHIHDRSRLLPHSQGAGNFGKAMAAFSRALALDSSFLIAYQHLSEGWAYCSSPASPFVCTADSAVYGTPDELAGRLGEGTVARLRVDAAENHIRTAYSRAAAAPDSPTALSALVNALILQGRFEEARMELSRLRGAGLGSQAAAREAQILLGMRRFPEAAARMREALRGVPDSVLMIPRYVYEPAPAILAAAGLMREAIAIARRVARAFPSGRSWPVGSQGGQFSMSKAAAPSWLEFWVTSAWSPDTAGTSRAAHRLLDEFRAAFRDDTMAFRRNVGRLTEFFAAYLNSRDTTVLSRWIASSDIVLWTSALAELALDRGDTARARSLAAQFNPRAPIRPRPIAGWRFSENVPDAYAWGHVFARLGEPRKAVDAYARLDSAPYDPRMADRNWVLLIRSYAERGALYQALGDRQRAIEMYQKFIDAWGEGDETVQPMVQRARDALAALRGEAPPPARR